MADITGTTANVWIATVQSDIASTAFRSKTVLWGLIDRRWEPALSVGRGDTVNVPEFTQSGLDTGTLSTGTATSTRTTFGTGAAPDFIAQTEVQAQIVVNQMAYYAFELPVELSPQILANYVPFLVEGISTACALKADADVSADNTNGLDALTIVGTDNVDVTEDNILTCIENLDASNAPPTNRVGVFSPQTRTSLRSLDRLSNSLYASAVGGLAAEKENGWFGSAYGLDFYLSNNLEVGSAGHKNAVFHQYVIAGVMQKKLTLLTALDITAGVFNQYLGYVTYGLLMMRNNTRTGRFGNELDGR